MSYRFSRRIRICKGVHLNVSKSGIGVSLGARGASISTGPRGTYVNMGIPGSGVSYRKKIDSSNTSNETFLSDSDVRYRDYIEGSNLKIQIDNDGKELVYMEAPDGTVFVDESMMRRVKRSDMYKEMLEITRKTKYDYMKQKNSACVDIYKSAVKLITENDVIAERDNPTDVSQQFYTMRSYDEPEPNMNKLYDEAHAQAISTVKTKMFWKKNKLISEATQSIMQEMHENEMAEWTKRRDDFLQLEKERKEQKDAEYKKDFEQRLAERAQTYDLILNPTDDYILDTVSDVLGQLELPVDFSIDYAVNNKEIELDIDLPEIEDFPQTFCTILSSGKLSIKKKNVSDLNKDYATGVIGMSFFFASLLFNISPKIEKITMAGYTQRTSKKTGNIEDQYVYSVTFTRDEYSKLNIENIDPIQAITNFEHTIDITNKYELKTIEVKESANRKTSDDKQENQTEYYTIDSIAKQDEPQIIERTLSTSSASNSSSNYYSSYNVPEREKTQYEKNQEAWKGPWGKVAKVGCAIWLAIFICLGFSMCVSVCSGVSHPDSNPHRPYRGD